MFLTINTLIFKQKFRFAGVDFRRFLGCQHCSNGVIFVKCEEPANKDCHYENQANAGGGETKTPSSRPRANRRRTSPEEVPAVSSSKSRSSAPKKIRKAVASAINSAVRPLKSASPASRFRSKNSKFLRFCWKAIIRRLRRPPVPAKNMSLGAWPISQKRRTRSRSDLPEAYGTKKLFLTARDPHWLYANWDLTHDQQSKLNARSAEGHLILRIYAEQNRRPSALRNPCASRIAPLVCARRKSRNPVHRGTGLLFARWPMDAGRRFQRHGHAAGFGFGRWQRRVCDDSV